MLDKSAREARIRFKLNNIVVDPDEYFQFRNGKKTNGCTKLMVLIYEKHYRHFAVKFINENPDQVNLTNGDGWTALHIACFQIEKDCCRYDVQGDIICALIDAGADINSQDNEGYTPLMRLLDRDDGGWLESVDIFNVLMGKSCDVNLQNWQGETALHIYIRYGSDPRIIAPILGAGFDINCVDDFGKNVLMIFASRYHGCYHLGGGVQIVRNFKTMIRHGININSQDQDGNTVLHMVARCNDLVQLLIQNGSDVNIRNNNNKSPIMLKHIPSTSIATLRKAGAIDRPLRHRCIIS